MEVHHRHPQPAKSVLRPTKTAVNPSPAPPSTSINALPRPQTGPKAPPTTHPRPPSPPTRSRTTRQPPAPAFVPTAPVCCLWGRCEQGFSWVWDSGGQGVGKVRWWWGGNLGLGQRWSTSWERALVVGGKPGFGDSGGPGFEKGRWWWGGKGIAANNGSERLSALPCQAPCPRLLGVRSVAPS